MDITSNPLTSGIPNMTTIATNSTLMPNLTTLSFIDTTTMIDTTTNTTNTTIPEYWGFITAGIAIVFYGSNFVPIKQFETGDGMFFQWVVCSAVMICGIIVQLITHQPPFYPLAMIGGVVWEVGNICVVPIVKSIGLGLGLCIWGMINLLSGWSTGRFGLFGINESKPDNETLNYVGVGLCVISAAVFSLIKNEITPISDNETEPLLRKNSTQEVNVNVQTNEALYSNTSSHDVLIFNRKRNSLSVSDDSDEDSFIDRLSPGMKRVVGIGLCIFSGLMYGQMFTGATYVQDNYHGASKNGLDYVFSCFCGIYLTSTAFFCVYIMFRRNKPKVYPKVILPGIISGIMWSVGTSCWFVANRSLSIPVAFPIVTTGPSIVASLWGTLVFREIRGTRNLLILMLGFAIAITGAVLAGVSKG